MRNTLILFSRFVVLCVNKSYGDRLSLTAEIRHVKLRLTLTAHTFHIWAGLMSIISVAIVARRNWKPLGAHTRVRAVFQISSLLATFESVSEIKCGIPDSCQQNLSFLEPP